MCHVRIHTPTNSRSRRPEAFHCLVVSVQRTCWGWKLPSVFVPPHRKATHFSHTLGRRFALAESCNTANGQRPAACHLLCLTCRCPTRSLRTASHENLMLTNHSPLTTHHSPGLRSPSLMQRGSRRLRMRRASLAGNGITWERLALTTKRPGILPFDDHHQGWL